MLFILTHEFFPKRGGIATFTEEMAHAASLLGHDVEVWAQRNASASLSDSPQPYKVSPLNLKGSHGFSCRMVHCRALVKRRRILRRSKVYLCEPGPMLALMPLLAFKAFRPRHCILTFHGSEILRFHADPVTRFFARRLILHAERISVLSSYTRSLVLDLFPASASKLIITPGALRSGFKGVTASPKRLGNRLIILTVGRIHPRKGQLATLDALLALPSALRNKIEYRIAGTIANARYASMLRSKVELADFPVTFLGDVPDDKLPALYSEADIFALTSREHGHSVEGFGLVYLEASACGLPIVAHNIGGVSEAVAHEITGLLASPENPSELTAVFRRLLEDETLRNRLGDAGPTWAARNSWGHSARLLFGHPKQSGLGLSDATLQRDAIH